MKINREEMMNNVMRKFGLEAEQTLAFCEIAETWKSDKAVAYIRINWGGKVNEN